MGGNHNPVPKLKQANYSLPITFYFPVRFKEDFINLYEYLADVFIGTYLNYGTKSGRAVSNISVPQYGEIVGLDLVEFEKWVNENYTHKIEVMENYLSMTITLYLSSIGADFLLGNDISLKMSYWLFGNTWQYDDVVFDDGSLISQTSPQSEQIEGENESHGLPFGATYSSSFKVFYKNNSFCNFLLNEWLHGRAHLLDITVTISIKSGSSTYDYERICYLESVNMPIQKGQPVFFTFSFAKKIVDEE